MKSTPFPFATPTSTDDAKFISRVDATVRGILELYQPSKVRLIAVDNWFGARWLGFSGKILGAAGLRRGTKRPTPPPFVPNRITSEMQWARQPSGEYLSTPIGDPLHLNQSAQSNTRRFLTEVLPETAVLWFTSNTPTNQRGALMAYIPSDEHYLGWYVGLDGNAEWGISQSKGISHDDFMKLQKLGEVADGALHGDATDRAAADH